MNLDRPLARGEYELTISLENEEATVGSHTYKVTLP
jgi:hypothetical protein